MVRAHLTIKDIRAIPSVANSHVRVRVESAASRAKFEKLAANKKLKASGAAGDI